MKYLLSASLLFLLASASNALAQSKADEEAVSKLPQEFCDAYDKHDGHALGKIMANDVDFVTVATTYLNGRADFETFHVRLLSGRFKDSTPKSSSHSAADAACHPGFCLPQFSNSNEQPPCPGVEIESWS
jgi:hypothetical protein